MILENHTLPTFVPSVYVFSLMWCCTHGISDYFIQNEAHIQHEWHHWNKAVTQAEEEFILFTIFQSGLGGGGH